MTATPTTPDCKQTVNAAGIACSDLFAIAADWRRDAEMHRNSCRQQEGKGDRGRADRHYQRALDLDACAKRLEDLANKQADRSAPTAGVERKETHE
jgi:hypothetical protein